MKIAFGNQSSIEIQLCSYEMTYGTTVKSYQERGLLVHLSSQDAKTPLTGLQLVHQTLEIPAPIRYTIQTIATFIAPNLGKLSLSSLNGSLDILALPHALKIASTNAFDPNPLYTSYAPVRHQLLALNPNLAVVDTIPYGTQSICRTLSQQAVSVVEVNQLLGLNPSRTGAIHSAIDTNYVAIASEIYQTVFPGVRIPAYSALVGDFVSYIVADMKRASNVGLAASVPVVPGVAWLSSVEAQTVLRNLQQNPSRYEAICNQISTKWKSVAESLGTAIPQWPNATLLQASKGTPAHNTSTL